MDKLNNQLAQVHPNDFIFLKKNGVRSSILLNFDFEDITLTSWGLLKETLPDLFVKNDFQELFFLLLKDRGIHVFRNDIEKVRVKDAMSFILWIIDELGVISELERTYLRSDPDVKLVQAGINRLDQFGLMNTLDNLTDGKFWDYDKVRKSPYNVIFDKQYKSIIINDVEKKLSKLK